MSARDTGIADPYAPDGDDDYIKVSNSEESELMEFPKEDNGTVMLSTIQAQFPHAIGLKFKSSSGAWRGIRAVDNVLDAPRGGWGDRTYYVTISESLKRKRIGSLNGDKETSNGGESKIIKPAVDPLLQDMAILGLPYKTTDEELKEYFETNCGELAYSEVKLDRNTGKSRGFGFIRFKSREGAQEALNGNHYIQGRKLEVRQKQDEPMKMFVGRLPRGTTEDDLTKYFSEFGELSDVYIPTPFRGFAFITFASTEVGRNVLRQNHVLEGIRLNVEERKDVKQRNQERRSFGNRSNTSFGGGDSTRYNPSNVQHATPDDMASELKNMLFKFLQN